jgi:phosphatidylinositol alpha-mannosyltransferase
MAAGKPVVASDIEGYNGIVTDGKQGLLVPKCDPQALAETLSYLANNPDLRARMGTQGQQMVEQFRWSSVARRIEDYYYETIETVQQTSEVNGRSSKRAV